MPRNRLPRVIKYYSPTGRRNHGRPLKRFLDTWDRNVWTSGPTPWKIYDDDDNDDENFASQNFTADVFVSTILNIIGKCLTKEAGRSFNITSQLTWQGQKLPHHHVAQLIARAFLASTHRYCRHLPGCKRTWLISFPRLISSQEMHKNVCKNNYFRRTKVCVLTLNIPSLARQRCLSSWGPRRTPWFFFFVISQLFDAVNYSNYVFWVSETIIQWFKHC